ncbi:FAD/NAD(P)-binding oxidoreductase [Chromobacterium phragmitis]|uniref:FAD/NAD(P)-binding oxidoreductase n=1 Tax=Chromobacterium phragmitis TaxID=2202141 RepID=A0A344UMT7_9NEIS|nr:FAD/NAD(P)-binding oxidoreductase [Chromobacterium phragmitis]AXE31200.1 FAD/NAD(P)-binding oxidoreductase [Chromobacterium phragmitis]AXE36585.1 FAD/NAD(P)-binding oxidoreductase [Chromobacterium phragmitis]
MNAKPVIVGGGPAGMSAAMELARHGVECVLLDEASRVGGVVYRGPLREGVVLDYLGERYRDNMQALHREFEQHRARVDIRLNTRIVGGSDNELFALSQDDQVAPIPYSQLLLAAGCHERSVPFPGWTTPGVIMLGGLQLQIKSGVVKPLGRTVLVGTGPLLPLVACQLHRAGAEVAGVYEASAFGRLAKEAIALLNQPQLFLDGLSMVAYLKRHGIPLHYGWGVVEAHGEAELSEVTVAPYDADWNADLTRTRRFPAQTLAVGYGFIPRTQLTQQMGLEHHYADDGFLKPASDDWQRSSRDNIHLAGDIGGLRGGEAAMISGRIAALSMLLQLGKLDERQALSQRQRLLDELASILRFRKGIDSFTRRGRGQLALPARDTVICRCEHATRQDIDTALEQGVNDLISLKMRTRVSMGDCQGKMCVGYCSDRLREHTGKRDVGWIRPRFPLDPLPFSAFSAIDAQQTEEEI